MKLLILLLLSSCSLFLTKKELPKNELSKMNFAEMQKYLNQTETMAGKTFYVSATPLTKKFIQQRAENQNIVSLNKNFADLLNRKTCFELELLIDRPGKKEAANFKNWKGYVIDNKGGIHFIKWENINNLISEVPSKSYFGDSVAYSSEALGCTDKLSISKGMTLHLYLEKQLAPWPFSEKVSINWIPLNFKETKEGKVFIEPKKKIKKQYRGW